MTGTAGTQLSLPPVLTTSRLCLRPLTHEDAPAIFAYAKDESVARYVLWDEHRSLEDSLAYLGLVHNRYARAEPFDWGVVFQGRLVGTVGLFDVRHDLERAEVGYALGREWWGRGLMREAVHAVVEHAFGGLALRRLIARTHLDNTASQRLLEGLGFLREGTLREDLYAKNRWWTTAYYGLLVGEFRPLPPPPRARAPRARRSASGVDERQK